jgi:hypothetical protein
MANTRQKGLRYLDGFLGQPRPACIAVSKFFPPKESWTGREAWWFDLPIEKIKRRPEEYYWLLGECDDEDKFVILEVPNQFLLKEMGMNHFDIRYRRRIRLHLAAYDENWLIDERSRDRVSFCRFLRHRPCGSAKAQGNGFPLSRE